MRNERCFNPRTRESATSSAGKGRALTEVSIHALVRVRPYSTVIYPSGEVVSIHALVRVRLSRSSRAGATSKVSIHALVRVRPPLSFNLLFNKTFQSTHSWECDRKPFSGATVRISFNPRTRESATSNCGSYQDFCIVSIHALVRVRLFNKTKNNEHIYSFNPRTRESATWQNRKLFIRNVVSIHALVRVRHDKIVSYSSAMLFQSTHSWECDMTKS